MNPLILPISVIMHPLDKYPGCFPEIAIVLNCRYPTN